MTASEDWDEGLGRAELAELLEQPDGLAQVAEGLRRWAKGAYATEAAVDLLLEHESWVRRPAFLTACMGLCEAFEGDPPMVYVDWPSVVAYEGPASSSEDSVRFIAAELAGYKAPDGLASLVQGLDATNMGLVLNAVAHAGGWHERGPGVFAVDGLVVATP